ncbi:ArnT family glycosyltransferase [Labedaea rhizosphaerae]|uniref:4-amino-4-deoxy-L-arabinose transferase-like glycosyltransferase n=1 Tax=Labedaea rhizosphaerae TaxID=598644 RepID=A0A4R6RVQ0_LABRH|nr:glycosyltransferase family 39 protein [Labedaea rhizosphaerae]TDP91072.1 4-amino-4-deoxy-L-arabinose transferase-like glycosyltransferase [Labedaea rhizosphaerae]
MAVVAPREDTQQAALPSFAAKPVLAVVVVQAAVLTALSGRYGWHRDEFYYLAAGKRLAWGYVDQPPITPVLARLFTEVFGDTVVGLRVSATLLGVATVLVTALIARECGGGRTAQWLTAAATALSTYVLVSTHMLSTTTVDTLVWTTLALFALRLLRTGDTRWWLAIGAVVGVGMANKWLVPLFLLALAIGVLAFGPRSVLRSWWLAAGVVLALALLTPVLIWQARHDFPLLTVAGGISADDGVENRVMFVPMELVYSLPVLVPVWFNGMLRTWRELRWARAVAMSYPVVCVVLLISGGKPYYAASLLLVLTAIGAEPFVRWLRSASRTWRAITAVGAAISLVVSCVVGLPLLPERAAGPALALNAEVGEQMGWPTFVDTVAAVWRQIPEADRGRAVILTANYGEAGAIEYYGPERGLPQPYSGHMSYADWGPPPDTSNGPVLLIGVGVPSQFVGCREVTANDNGLGIDNDEQGMPIRLCTGTTAPWSQIWPGLRRFY